jgi:O-antigen ligase
MMGVWDLIHWFFLILVTVSVVRRPQEWRALFNSILVVTLLLELLALAQAFGWRVDPKSRVDATLGNPTYLGAILAVGIMLAIGLISRSFLPRDREKKETPGPSAASFKKTRERLTVLLRHESLGLWGWRSFWALVAVLGMWVIFETGTRGALLGLISGLVTMLLAWGICGRRRLLLPVALVVAGFLLVTVTLIALSLTVGLPLVPGVREPTVFSRLPNLISDTEVKAALSPRLTSSEAGVRAFLQRPILGWGPENFEAAFDRFAESAWFMQGARFVD